MKFFYLVFGVLFFAGCVKSQTGGPYPVLINGTDVGMYTEQYPFIVQLESYIEFFAQWKLLCAASIFSNSWLLSSAHCFEGKAYTAENTRIRAGTTHLGKGGVVHYVDYVRNHPDFKKAARNDADISCVKLVTPSQFSNVIQPAEINYSNIQLPPDTPVQYIGWGAIFVGGPQSDTLLHVTVDIVHHTQCVEQYKKVNGTVTSTMICAGHWAEGGVGSCQGDSGGHLYYHGVVFGIVSWGYSCAKPQFPGVSTDIASYAKCINETVQVNI